MSLNKKEQDEKNLEKKSLVKAFKYLEKQGLKVKTAICLGSRVIYFRIDDFIRLVKQNHQQLKLILNNPIYNDFQGNTDISIFGQKFFNHKLAIFADRVLEKQGKKLKWPKKLVPAKKQEMGNMGFMIWIHKESRKMTTFLLVLVVTAVIGICLFPIWPRSTKIYIWTGCVYLLVLMIGLLVVRLMGFFIFWVLGIDFWILPNFFNDDATIKESLWPLISVHRNHDSWTVFWIRIATALVLGVFVYIVSQDPTYVSEYREFASQSIFEMKEWGFEKLAGPENATYMTEMRRHKSLADEILSEIEEEQAKQNQQPPTPDYEPEPTHSTQSSDIEEPNVPVESKEDEDLEEETGFMFDKDEFET